MDRDKDEDKPSLRQKLSWATGDREREAEALADNSPDGVTKHDAKVAVARAPAMMAFRRTKWMSPLPKTTSPHRPTPRR
jgi:hypothetical protein